MVALAVNQALGFFIQHVLSMTMHKISPAERTIPRRNQKKPSTPQDLGASAEKKSKGVVNPSGPDVKNPIPPQG